MIFIDYSDRKMIIVQDGKEILILPFGDDLSDLVCIGVDIDPVNWDGLLGDQFSIKVRLPPVLFVQATYLVIL